MSYYDKYYDKKQVKEIIKRLTTERGYFYDDDTWYTGVCAVDGELEQLPTYEFPAETELRQGYWILSKYQLAKCSWCGKEHAYPSTWNFSDCKKYWHYCPSCGAKMPMEF